MKLKALGLCAALVLAGCGSPEVPGNDAPDANVASVAEAAQGLGIGDSCETATANASFTGMPFAYSPATYGTTSCDNGFLVDLTSRRLAAPYNGTYVSFADHRVPTTEAECARTSARAYVWSTSSGASPLYLGVVTAKGRWQTAEGACEVPVVRLEDAIPLETDKNYRIAVQARLDAATGSSYSLREVAVTPAPVYSNGARTVVSTSDNIGSRVAILGSLAVVQGTQGTRAYRKSGSTWSLEKDWPFDGHEAVSVGTGIGGEFIAIGAPPHEVNWGRVTLYAKSGSEWTDMQTWRGYREGAVGSFGSAVFIGATPGGRLGVVVGDEGLREVTYYRQAADGSFPLAHTAFWPTGTRPCFTCNATPEWLSETPVGYGAAVAMIHPYVFVGTYGAKAVRVYSTEDLNYSALITPDAPSEPGSLWFGKALAVVGQRLFVAGLLAVHEFQLTNGTWTQRQRFYTPHPGHIISSLAAATNALFIGNSSASGLNSAQNAGGVTMFTERSGRWAAERRFIARDPVSDALFGSAVAATATDLIVGAPGQDAFHNFALGSIPCTDGPQCEEPVTCQANEDCGLGLICASATQGQLRANLNMKVCVPDACATSISCSAECPCSEGGTDADSDEECRSGLALMSDVGDRFGMQRVADACVEDCSLITGYPGDPSYCGPTCPCGVGVGHCENDGECVAGTFCKANAGAAFGFTASTSVCVPNHCSNKVLDYDEQGVDCGGVGCGRCSTCPAFSALGADNFCTDQCPCEVTEGDCDDVANKGCRQHTADYGSVTVRCVANVGSYYGFALGVDVCERADCAATRVSPNADSPGDTAFCSDKCPCAKGFGDCDEPTDCVSGLTCNQGANNGVNFGRLDDEEDACVSAHCLDDVKNADETDVDCGGADCGGCKARKDCNTDTDCVRDLDGDGSNDLLCHDGQECMPKHCYNTVQDWAEMGLNCGGGCNGCAIGSACDSNSDCASNSVCLTRVCRELSCENDQKDGSETGVDCGGSCPTCGESSSCSATSDCSAGLTCTQDRCVRMPDCSTAVCANPSDGIGGECPAVCGDGEGGCTSDVHCQPGSTCVTDALGSSSCRPESVCSLLSISTLFCGYPGALCGAQCPAAVDGCQNRVCGESPLTGTSCGSCTGATFCNLDGQCIARVTDPVLTVPNGQGGVRTVSDIVATSTATEVGAVGGSFSVSARGTPNYTIPIEVPPGRMGLEPKLAFSYVGARSNGDLGMGWILSGLSSITRCPRTLGQDGHNRGITNSVEDRFCLDGERLELLNEQAGGYGGHGTEYRTAVDTFAKVISYLEPNTPGFQLAAWPWIPRVARAAGGPDSFRVWTRDGLILTFGATRDSLIMSRDGRRRAWLLNKVEDRAGNNLLVSYSNVDDQRLTVLAGSVPSVVRPLAIAYTGFGNSAGNREVRFTYNDNEHPRPDPVLGFRHGGLPTSSPKRLTRVTTYVKGVPVLGYKIEYAPGSLSQIEKISKCVGLDDATCTRPTTFTYNQDVGFTIADRFPSPRYGSTQLDIDGNGIPDMLRTTFSVEGADNSTLSSVRQGADMAVGIVADSFLGAGSSVIVTPLVHFLTAPFWGLFAEKPRITVDRTVMLSTGNRAVPQTTINNVPGLSTCSNSARSYLADYNLDHRDDFLTLCSDLAFHTIDVSLSEGNGQFTAAGKVLGNNGLWLTIAREDLPAELSDKQQCNQHGCINLPEPGPDPLMFDVDGDGLDDVVACRDTETLQFYRRRGATQGFALPVTIASNGYYCTDDDVTHAVFDADGDGIMNLLARGPLDWGLLRYDGLTSTLSWNRDVLDDVGLSSKGFNLVSGDFNGDGLIDIWSAQGAQAVIWLNTGTGRFEARTLERPQPALARGFNVSHYRRAIAIDYNGDGRAELLELWDRRSDDDVDYESYVLYPDLATGRVTAEVNTDIAYDNLAGTTTQNRWFQPIDLDGDGSLDLLGEWGMHYGRTSQTKLLTRVEDGDGKYVEVAYESSAYVAEAACTSGTGWWQERCLPKMHGLVSKHREGHMAVNVNGTSPKLEREYRYVNYNGKTSLTGYGFLGFERREVKEFAYAPPHDFVPETFTLRQTVQTEYEPLVRYNRQGNALSNVDSTTVHYYPLATLPRSTTVETPSVANALMSAAFVRRVISTNTWRVRRSASDRIFPYLASKTTEVFEVSANPVPAPGDSGTRLSETSESFNVNNYGNITSHVVQTSAAARDSCGRTTTTKTFTPNVSSWLISNPETVSTEGSRDGSVATQSWDPTYDSRGLVTSVIRNGTSSEYRRTTYARDAWGNVTGVTEQINTGQPSRITRVSYDADQIFPLTVTDAKNFVYQVRTDARWGTPTSVADPNGIVEQWAYDGLGKLVENRGATGSERLSYARVIGSLDVVSKPERVTQAAYAVTRTRSDANGSGSVSSTEELDAYGRTVRTRSPGLDGVTMVEEQGFDHFGRVVGRTLPYTGDENSAPHIRYAYDNLDRVVSETHTKPNPPDSSSEVASKHYQYASRVTLNTANSAWLTGTSCASEVVLAIDEETKQAASVTDPHGKVLRSIDGNNLATAANSVRYSYGAFDRVTTVADNLGFLTSFTYDAYGRMLTHRDPDSGVTTYTYDGFDQLRTSLDPNTQSRQYNFDELGRLLSITGSGGISEWIYDTGVNALGRLSETLSPTTALNPAGRQRTLYSYEAPTSTTNRGLLQKVTSVLDGEEYPVTMTYDSWGRTQRVEYPRATTANPVIAEYGYNAQGILTSLSEVGGGSTRPLWQLNEAFEGHLTQRETFGNGAVTTYAYNPGRRWLQNISTSLGTQQVQSLEYTHYKNGLVQERNDANQLVSEYFYDALNRLSETRDSLPGATRSTAYTYDAIDNLTQNGSKSLSYQATRPHLLNSVGENQYVYDQKGNVTSRTGPDIPLSRQTLEYTPFNLPTVVRTGAVGSEDVTNFEYDADERRVVQRQVTDTRYFIPDLYEHRIATGTGVTQEERFKLYAGSRLIGEIVRGTGPDKTLYFHNDHLGTVDTVTDSNQTAARQQFDSFGAPNGNPQITRNGYTGHDHDRDLAFINMRGRIYDPLAGRFMTPDPVLSEGLNRYSYVGNNPINATDPSGFLKWDQWVGVGLFAVGYGTLAYGIGEALASSAVSSSLGAAGTSAAMSLGTSAASSVATNVISAKVALENASANRSFDKRVRSTNSPQNKSTLLGRVTTEKGTGLLFLQSFEATRGGARLKLGYVDGGTGYSHFNWVQTVNTDQPGVWPDGVSRRENPRVDGYGAVDQNHYFSETEVAARRGKAGYSLTFYDEPSRGIQFQPVHWKAELSLVGKQAGDLTDTPMLTIEWGFWIPRAGGPTQLLAPRVVRMPTTFHLNAIQ